MLQQERNMSKLFAPGDFSAPPIVAALHKKDALNCIRALIELLDLTGVRK